MKAKLKKIGNSMYILVPKKIVEPFVACGEIEVYFSDEYFKENKIKVVPATVIEKREPVPAPEKTKKPFLKLDKEIIINGSGNSEFCKKHKGSRKWTCGCK